MNRPNPAQPEKTAATGLLAPRRLRNDFRNSILMSCHGQILVVLLIARNAGENCFVTNQKH